MKRSSWLWPLLIIISAIGAGLVVFAEVESFIRPLLTFWFLLVCPGMAFVRLLRLKDSIAEWTLAIALSLALDAIVAMVLLYMRSWSPRLGLVILIGFSLAGAAFQVIMPLGRVITSVRLAPAVQPLGMAMNAGGSPGASPGLLRAVLGAMARLALLFILWSTTLGGLALLTILLLQRFNGG